MYTSTLRPLTDSEVELARQTIALQQQIHPERRNLPELALTLPVAVTVRRGLDLHPSRVEQYLRELSQS